VKGLVVKRVAGEINCVCGRCDLCLAGLSTHCRKRTVLGILNHGGAFADYLRLPAANLHALPDAIDNDQAVFIEPLAAAFQVLKQVKVDTRTWVTVLGDGRLGLLVAQVLQATGAPVRVIGKHQEKLSLCDRWSIRSRLLADVVGRHDQDVVVDCTGNPARHDQDVVVDCTGNPAGLEMAMQMVRPRGTIVLKSTFAGGKPLNLAPVVIDEVTVVGSRCGPFKEAIRALAAKQVDVASLITRRMKIEQGVAAMELAKRSLKVILTME
jgi:threonine dehydrogenase-like Zn-dependent dehydrogenase